jgi:hypothetical protein
MNPWDEHKDKADSILFTGNPCLRGHDGLRYRNNGGCVYCVRLRAKLQRQLAREKRQPQLDLFPSPSGACSKSFGTCCPETVTSAVSSITTTSGSG